MENYFYKKYEPINWKEDGKIILSKIGNNLTSRFGSMDFEIVDDNDGFRIEISQDDNFCSFSWSFNEDELYAQVENSDGIPLKDMGAVEDELEKCGLVKESKNTIKDMKNLRTFENWKNDRAEAEMRKSGEEIMKDAQSEEKDEHSETCDCGKGKKEDCNCGPDCDCKACKDKYSKED